MDAGSPAPHAHPGRSRNGRKTGAMTASDDDKPDLHRPVRWSPGQRGPAAAARTLGEPDDLGRRATGDPGNPDGACAGWSPRASGHGTPTARQRCRRFRLPECQPGRGCPEPVVSAGTAGQGTPWAAEPHARFRPTHRAGRHRTVVVSRKPRRGLGPCARMPSRSPANDERRRWRCGEPGAQASVQYRSAGVPPPMRVA